MISGAMESAAMPMLHVPISMTTSNANAWVDSVEMEWMNARSLHQQVTKYLKIYNSICTSICKLQVIKSPSVADAEPVISIAISSAVTVALLLAIAILLVRIIQWRY